MKDFIEQELIQFGFKKEGNSFMKKRKLTEGKAQLQAFEYNGKLTLRENYAFSTYGESTGWYTVTTHTSQNVFDGIVKSQTFLRQLLEAVGWTI